MGELIVFYVPANFEAPAAKWMPPSVRGKIIDFHVTRTQKSAQAAVRSSPPDSAALLVNTSGT
jgi:hypothetical protein